MLNNQHKTKPSNLELGSHYHLAKSKSRRTGDNKHRIALIMLAFFALFGAICVKLVSIGMMDSNEQVATFHNDEGVQRTRPDLLDRNGEMLATDIHTPSLYAEPVKILDIDETVEKLSSVLPDLRSPNVRKRLESDAGFIWLKREITEDERQAILELGVPGTGFQFESRRFYPGKNLASHIVGHVDVDNKGIAGIEKYLDREGLADLHIYGLVKDDPPEPVKLSIDIRAQHIVRNELSKALEKYRALAAIGIVLNIETGEVVAMSSLPDYNPNRPKEALESVRLNRATAGVFEMGSVMKILTTAMALDSGKVTLDDSFDASKPIIKSRHTIRDYRGKNRVLKVPEVFIYSSNIGTAKMTLEAGIETQRDFLQRTGMLENLPTELPESAKPLLPPKWGEIEAMTISFGHGLSVSPMHTAVATASLINGGKYIPPTFLLRSKSEADELAVRVVDEPTSDSIRYLLRKNVLEGSGRSVDVNGYLTGGKTGTAEKVVDGRYSSEKRFNSFIAGFPMDDPQYLVLVALDEPKPEEGFHFATAGYNAGPTTAAIIRRIGPLLGVRPRHAEPEFKVETLLQEEELAAVAEEPVGTTN